MHSFSRYAHPLLLAGILSGMIGCQTNDPQERPAITNPAAPRTGEASVAAFEQDSEKVIIASSDREALEPKIDFLAKRSADPLAAQKLYKVRMDYIARALAKAMLHPDICKAIKNETGKRFDDDLNVLWSSAKDLPIAGKSFGRLVESRFGGLSAANIGNLFDMKLLQIAMPVNFDKWKGDSPLLVGYMTYDVDDTQLETITAYDANLKAYTLNAKVKPEYPVVILSLNERINPATMRRKSVEREEEANKLRKEIAEQSRKFREMPKNGLPDDRGGSKAQGKPAIPLQKSASSANPQHIYLEWFKTSDTYDPWPASDGEFATAVMTDVQNGDGSFKVFNQEIKTGVKSGSWYQRHIGLFQYESGAINKYCYLKFYEDDTWEFDVNMSMKIEAKGAIDYSKTQTFSANIKIGNGDDVVGGSQFSVDLGPFNPQQNSHANILNAGSVQYAVWWGDMNNDGVILATPYSTDGSNVGKSDRWPVPQWPTSPDFTYSIYVETQATLNINTCHASTAMDTYLTVYNKYGSVVAHNDDNWDIECGNYRSKIVTTLPTGYYYVNVQGYYGSSGNFHLNVVKQ